MMTALLAWCGVTAGARAGIDGEARGPEVAGAQHGGVLLAAAAAVAARAAAASGALQPGLLQVALVPLCLPTGERGAGRGGVMEACEARSTY